MKIHADTVRFRELLPFWVNGTLDTNDQAFIQDYMQRHPDAVSELAFTQQLQTHIQNQDAPYEAADEGLDHLLKQWHRPSQKQADAHIDTRPWWDRWHLSPAMAVAMIVIVVQSVFILREQLAIRDDRTSMYRSETTQTINYQLKVIVKPDTNFVSVSDMLRSQGAQIVAGPTAAGEIWIKLDGDREEDKVRKILMDSGLVEDVLSTHEMHPKNLQ